MMDAFKNNVIDLDGEYKLELRTGQEVTIYTYRATSAHLHQIQKIEEKISALKPKDPDVLTKRDELLMDEIRVFIPDVDPDLPQHVSHARLRRIAATCIQKAQGDITEEFEDARKNPEAADAESKSAASSTTPSSGNT